jgi:hypothetical protein
MGRSYKNHFPLGGNKKGGKLFEKQYVRSIVK